jgi:cysteinyl-tRNA synthetase
MELSEETMAGASGGIERIDAFFRRMDAAKITAGIADDDIKKRFSEAMDNDLGTPDALAVIFESINAGNALLDSQDIEGAQNTLATVTELLEVLGLSQIEKDSDEEIEQLIQQREIARQGKNFEEADRIRDQLHSQGIEIEDTPSGTLWRYR